MKPLLRKATMLLLAMLVAVGAWGQQISETDALQKAQAFLAERGFSQPQQSKSLKMAVKGRRAKAKAAVCDYYIFNVGEENGFVVVSGDERAVPILGYANEGSIHQEEMPDGLRYMLDCYAEELAWLEEKGVNRNSENDSKAPRRSSKVFKSIQPLVPTRWNQRSPYNKLCPIIDGEQVVTGCVATSLSQIMYYHQWPQTTTVTIPAYEAKTLNQARESYTLTTEVLHELPSTTFSWDAMTTTYNNSSSTEAQDAVAQLMQYCGWALQMKYGLAANGGSSAYNASIPYALNTYFGYDGSAHIAFRQFYNYTEWVDLIYSELTERRPVVLGGQSAGGGHSFICDGFETDDYFHINWGWGGSSDGYFRLSALTPYDQGAGGSSTLDGFNYTQEAVIGIQKPTEGTKKYCLSNEKFVLGGEGENTLSSKTFTRDANDNFTGISVYIVMCSYSFGTNNYGIALQLVDADGNVVMNESLGDNIEMPFNKNISTTVYNIEIGSDIADGTYRLKIASRPHGASEWQECSNGDKIAMTAVISGNTLTINVPVPDNSIPSMKAITVSGNKCVGYEQEVIASMTGGVSDYHGNLFLYANNQLMMGKAVDIPAGQTVDVRFVFTPKTAGETTLHITRERSTDASYVIGTTSITISTSGMTNTQELTIEPTITNLNGGKLYGNAVRATLHVTNPSVDNKYASQLNCSLREYNNIDDDVNNYGNAMVQRQNITIDENSSVDVPFAFDGLDPTKFYRLRISYIQGYYDGEVLKTRTASGPLTECYAMGEGYALYAADGTTSVVPAGGSIDAGTAAFVDLTGMSDVPTLTTSTNPNCIYLLPSESSPVKGRAKRSLPASLSGKNVVRDGVAESLTLNDSYDFYSPISFTANTASYTRTFTLPAGGTTGWSTLILPFKPTSITCEEIGAVDWFHSSSDTGKNFWLRTFAADAEGSVFFDYPAELEANIPYIIAVPGDQWGDEWRMTSRPVTFSASNIDIIPTSEVSTNGSYYHFTGSTIASTLSSGYALNAEGSSFVLISTPTNIDAFRAWFTPVSISALTLSSLTIGDAATGIENLPSTPFCIDSEVLYDLSGRKITNHHTLDNTLSKGFYIYKGKKVLIR